MQKCLENEGHWSSCLRNPLLRSLICGNGGETNVSMRGEPRRSDGGLFVSAVSAPLFVCCHPPRGEEAPLVRSHPDRDLKIRHGRRPDPLVRPASSAVGKQTDISCTSPNIRSNSNHFAFACVLKIILAHWSRDLPRPPSLPRCAPGAPLRRLR